jgi:hypothetical protein
LGKRYCGFARTGDCLLAGKLLGIHAKKRNDEMVPGHCRDPVEPVFPLISSVVPPFFAQRLPILKMHSAMLNPLKSCADWTVFLQTYNLQMHA